MHRSVEDTLPYVVYQVIMLEIGEVWRSNNSNYGVTEGALIADFDDNSVTLVSLTGTRMKLAASSFQLMWQKVADAPLRNQFCIYKTCFLSAFLTYERPTLPSHRPQAPDMVCPFHIPKGVKSNICLEGPTESIIEFTPCPKCGYDRGGVEVLNELPLDMGATSGTHLWNCPRCGGWWLDHSIGRREIMERLGSVPPNYRNLGRALISIPGYTITNIVGELDPFQSRACYKATLKPNSQFNRLTGPKPLTLFDHLRFDE